jgi:hypothetical protein
VDEAYIRLANLKSICFSDGFRQEILSGNLGSYLIRGNHFLALFNSLITVAESSKCRERLRNTLTIGFYRLLDANPDRVGAVVKSLMDDFPTVQALPFHAMESTESDIAMSRCIMPHMLSPAMSHSTFPR